MSLHVGLDPNRDTPIETLHTFLLGIIKYCWRMVRIGWNAKDPELTSSLLARPRYQMMGLVV